MIKGAVFLFALCSIITTCMCFTVTLYGASGVGKSAIVRALCNVTGNGDAIAAISHQDDGTLEKTCYHGCTAHNITVCDTVGYGTRYRPRLDHVDTTSNISILCVGHRVYTFDEEAYAMIRRHTHCNIVLRTRCDVFPCNSLALKYTRVKYFPHSVIYGVSTMYGSPWTDMLLYDMVGYMVFLRDEATIPIKDEI